MITTLLNTKISEVENKVLDDAESITAQEFHRLIAENVAVRLIQPNLISKTDFDNKLISLNRKTKKKKKILEAQKI